MCKKENPIPGKIIAVTNRSLCERPFFEQIKRVCETKPAALILREKDLTEEEYRTLAKEVLEICNQYQVHCILHNFWKVAIELGCTSVHLPLPVWKGLSDDEKVYGRDYLKKSGKQKEILDKNICRGIGTSVHSVEEAKEAEALGAAYLTAGHIYATDCKKGLPPRGLEFLEEVCREVSIPVYGIGGIKFDEKQWQDMKECGAAGGCIMSGMMEI